MPTSTEPLVSIVIPFYNCSYIAQAIESALQQTYANVEIIVINDGATKYKELITPYLSDIIYLELEKNSGVAAALNKGLTAAKGDYIAWLSSDDIFNPAKVEKQLEFMRNKQALISFTNFNTIDENNNIIKYNVGSYFSNPSEVIAILTRGNPINGCTVMMSKTLVEDIGLFNESLRYAQDYEYWLRTALKYDIFYYHITLTNYRVHKEMGTILHAKDVKQEFEMVRDKFKEIIKTKFKL